MFHEVFWFYYHQGSLWSCPFREFKYALQYAAVPFGVFCQQGQLLPVSLFISGDEYGRLKVFYLSVFSLDVIAVGTPYGVTSHLPCDGTYHCDYIQGENGQV